MNKVPRWMLPVMDGTATRKQRRLAQRRIAKLMSKGVERARRVLQVR